MKRETKRLFRGWILGLVCVVAIPVSIRLASENFVKKRVYQFLTENTSMSMSLDRMKFGIMPGVLKLEGLTLFNKRGFKMNVAMVTTKLNLFYLLRHQKIKFHTIQCLTMDMKLNHSKIHDMSEEKKEDFVVNFLRQLVGLQSEHVVFGQDYFESLQIKDFLLHLEDELEDQNIHMRLKGDYVGIQHMNVPEKDSILRLEATGYGLDGLCDDYQFSFFISKEGSRWGQFKINHLDLETLDPYLNARGNAKITKGFFTSSILLQRAKESLRAQVFTSIDDFHIDVLHPTIKINKTFNYFEANDGDMEFSFFVDESPQANFVDDFAVIVAAFKTKLKQVVMAPSKDEKEPLST